MSNRGVRGRIALTCFVLAGTMPAWAIQPPAGGDALEGRAFSRPELYIPTSTLPLREALPQLSNRDAWQRFLAASAAPAAIPLCPICDVEPLPVFIDPRSGAAANILGAFPLLPGSGVGNHVTLGDVSARLGRRVGELSPEVVAELVLRFVSEHAEVLGIDPRQLGRVNAAALTPELWQFNVAQTHAGLAVRHARLAGTIKHGNLVLIGAESWADVVGLDPQPRLDASAALDLGFGWADGRALADVIESRPRLEVLPVSSGSDAFARGYAHRLVWSFTFRREPEVARWEVLVDAHTGDVLSFADTNSYMNRHITGTVFPMTNTDICPDAARCGVAQKGWPMPDADTAQPQPFANGAGVYNYTSGTATTTLSGFYADLLTDNCGMPLSLSSTTGTLNLGGSAGQHDCATPGIGGPGNTPSSRTAYYETNKIHEIARGYLPSNPWLQGLSGKVGINTNINSSCNAFYSGNTINFFRANGGCRNTGENFAVVDHEWGHALDDFDANGVLSNSSEAYADIAAVYRTQSSCVGYGFWWTASQGCGATSDGTGQNCKEGPHCCADCSGVRDADYLRYVGPPAPFTPQNFVCPSCGGGSGPCGRQVHCAAAPSRQAAWDFAARDLQSPPFSLDSQTAFIVANKLFYQGSGNIGLWHNCNCTAGTSDGCGATNAYMQWLAADDDDGNVNNGTPHFTAIRAAFSRHNIACASPCAGNCGCSGGPTLAPTLTATRGVYQVSLSWTAVAAATRYWVFRTEGHAGCHFGKALIAETTGLSYVDTEVLPCRTYYYNVVAAGASSACYGKASNCAAATPTSAPLTLCAIADPEPAFD